MKTKNDILGNYIKFENFCKCEKPELNINYICKKCGKPIKIKYESILTKFDGMKNEI